MVEAIPAAAQTVFKAGKRQITKEFLAESKEYAKQILIGLNASPSHFHAVNYCKDLLKLNGFTEIKETESWSLEAGKGYYFTRNGSTICAFLTGNKLAEESISAFKIVGCHTDSPVLKIAPHSRKESCGFNQLNVMTYGGGLWRTWFDRDLSLAGKVIVQDGDTLQSKYWNAGRALLKVPSLAIHLDRSDEFKPNKETHLKPILATGVVNQLFGTDVEKLEDDKFQLDDRHLNTMTDLMATDLEVQRDSIIDFELTLYDTQPACLFGLHDEFVSSPRLDNLASSLCALDAIIEHSKAEAARRDHSEIDMIMLFDHEEVGSQSAQGADSNMAVEITQRIFEGLGGTK